MGLHTQKDQKRFLTILADGQLHERVDEDTNGATIRTKKEQDGTVVEVLDKDDNQIYELKYPGITAMIKKIQFNEGDYGTSVHIDLEDEDDNQFILSLSCSSKYGERFMEVLPNLDLNEEVEFKPFAFRPKGSTDKIRGLSVLQDGEKIESAFSIKNGDEWEVLVKGYPMPDPKKKYNTEKWKTFFAQRREWLMDYLIDEELVLPADATAAPVATEEVPKAKKGKKAADGEEEDDSF